MCHAYFAVRIFLPDLRPSTCDLHSATCDVNHTSIPQYETRNPNLRLLL